MSHSALRSRVFAALCDHCRTEVWVLLDPVLMQRICGALWTARICASLPSLNRLVQPIRAIVLSSAIADRTFVNGSVAPAARGRPPSSVLPQLARLTGWQLVTGRPGEARTLQRCALLHRSRARGQSGRIPLVRRLIGMRHSWDRRAIRIRPFRGHGANAAPGVFFA